MRILLVHNELFFYSPSTLNAPFDSKVEFDFENLSDEDIQQFLNKATIHGTLQFDIEQALGSIRENKDGWKQQVRRSALGHLQPEINALGLLCLSTLNDDIRMWSLYADKHKGLCLEFDKTIMEAWQNCSPVHYDSKFLSFGELNDAFPEDNETLARLLLLRKAKHWMYESEWRTIVKPPDGENRYYKFPEKLLTGVIFGCQMSDDEKRVIKAFLKDKKKHVQCYDAKKKANEFVVEIVPCTS
jgi:Protein of unknown function (DUF2971)